MSAQAAERVPARPPLPALALVFARIGLSSFGGGNAAWIRRELVERRHWWCSPWAGCAGRCWTRSALPRRSASCWRIRARGTAEMERPLLDLARVFAVLSLMSIGGGSATIAEMQRQVVAHHWLTPREF